MKRQTMNVKKLLDEVNERNRVSTCDSKVREGWNSILEYILMQTGNYRGFGYMDAARVPKGELPGIVWKDMGDGHMVADWSQPTDGSRRFFYY